MFSSIANFLASLDYYFPSGLNGINESLNYYFPLDFNGLNENFKIPEMGELRAKFLIYTTFLFLYVGYLYFFGDPGDGGNSAAGGLFKVEEQCIKIPTVNSLVFLEDDVADKYLAIPAKNNEVRNIVLLTISIFVINIFSLMVSECIKSIT